MLSSLESQDNDRIFAEYDQNGKPIQETVYFGSTPVALLKDGQTYRIFADQIDTPRVITDSHNTTLWAWDSKPFGESKPNEDVDGDGTKLSYNLRLPGQYYDGETGKHYNFNRDYDPVTGRYVQSDPIGLDGGMNGYGYAEGSPTNTVDFNGNAPTRIISPKGNKVIDISIDVHDYRELSLAKQFISTYKNLKFTVYIYPSLNDKTMELIVAGAYEVGLHAIRGRTVSFANTFFGSYYGGRIPVAIHGGNNIRLLPNEMQLLARYHVPFVRAAEDSGDTRGFPPVRLTYSGKHSFNKIMTGSLGHYFVHTNPKKDKSVPNARRVLWSLNRYAR